jgi:hypothetical protein
MYKIFLLYEESKMKKIILFTVVMVAVAWGISFGTTPMSVDSTASCFYDCMSACQAEGKDDATCNYECNDKCS